MISPGSPILVITTLGIVALASVAVALVGHWRDEEGWDPYAILFGMRQSTHPDDADAASGAAASSRVL